MKVKELMSTDVVTVGKDERLERVLELMRKHNVSKLPVTEHGRLTAVVTDGNVVDELGALRNRNMSPTTLHVSTAMERQFPTAGPDDDVRHLVDLCKKEGVGIIPVTSDGMLLGVVTKADLLRLVTSSRKLAEIMATRLHAVSPEDRVVHARRMMLDHGIERLPVLDGGKLAGLVSELDLAFALDNLKRRHQKTREDHELRNLLIRDVMRTSVVTAPPDMTAARAAKIMREEDIGCLPVVAGDKIIGMVTRTDLIREIATV